jgi:hypothetical protein
MFWNKDHRGKKMIFGESAENDLGLFYDNKNCDQCFDDCCILLEGGGDSPVLLEGFSSNFDCILLEGCTNELTTSYFIAVQTT